MLFCAANRKTEREKTQTRTSNGENDREVGKVRDGEFCVNFALHNNLCGLHLLCVVCRCIVAHFMPYLGESTGILIAAPSAAATANANLLVSKQIRINLN